ncbi:MULTISPECIES: phage tail tip fiber protein [Enterobacter]|uniref:phage tail tip fiber protein n=1 Tax=Enterobacter TaxID=547 RepID=UPI001F0C6351|nr:MULTISPECIES: DUF1983 domain-containing protein [unclassified Enterobacter]
MSQTYQVCEVTVTLPSLGTVTTDGAGNRIEHGDKCRVHLYAVKPDWHSGTIFEGFNVGAITFTGYTDSPFKRSQKIMVPDGYKLVALQVDDDGVPTSWDSLPVNFSGGYIGSPVDDPREETRNHGSVEGLEWGWFVDKAGQAYIHKALIGDGVLSTGYNVKLNVNVTDKGKQHEAGMTLGVEEGKQQVTFKADRFKVHEAAQSASNNEETAFNGGLAFGGFPGAISHDGANPADGNNATAEPISSIASATGTATKARLTDEMQELVLKAVRESDLFTSLQTAIAAKAASTAGLQQAVNDAVSNAIRNALKPGGLLYGKR